MGGFSRRLALLTGGLLSCAVLARAQELPGQTVEVSQTPDNGHYVLCPLAYRSIPCPSCPGGTRDLCGDVPGILPWDLGDTKLTRMICGQDGESAPQIVSARLASLRLWQSRLTDAAGREESVAGRLRAQAALYGGKYRANGEALTSAAEFVDYTVEHTLQTLRRKVGDAQACLAGAALAGDGCYYYPSCGALDGLEEDLGARFPAALTIITGAVGDAVVPADAGLPRKHVVLGRDVCAPPSPSAPCLQQMDPAVTRVLQEAMLIQSDLDRARAPSGG